MEQLILHLFGDYLTQTDMMAKKKTSAMGIALFHAIVYTLPFVLVFDLSLEAVMIICFSHALIDRYRLARYVVFAKNWITQPSLRWEDCSETGYHKDTPPWLAFWLLIIADNTLHLAINYAAIRWA